MIRRRPRIALLAACLLLAGITGLTGCGGGAAATPTSSSATSHQPAPAPDVSLEVAPQQVPGVGPKTWAEVPRESRQVVLVTGRGKNSPQSTVVLYERTEAGWQAGTSWPAHNALKGWTDHHTAGDLRSPIGVYTLTDAGGLLRDPGTRLPYDRSIGFTAPGTGFEGEPLTGSFDYVIAINYNRKPGTTPLDWTRPLGAGRGGGIWLHVDHDGPTHGCVSVDRAHMRDLLLALDPDAEPVVVMGDRASLAR